MAEFSPKFKEALSLVQKPGRYTGGEPGCVYKDKSRVDVRMAFCFPDTYEIGMSFLGEKILYDILNRHENWWCERAFMPWTDMKEQMERLDIPLYCLESKDPLTDFDIVGFSLEYELAYTNVLAMLRLSGIPLRAADRDERWPLIISGGPCVCNAEPMADFFDVMQLGEGEQMLQDICAAVEQGKKQGWPVCIRPTLTGEKPSTSFSGGIASMTAFSSIWAGSGSCTKMPSISFRPFSSAMRASSSSRPVFSGRVYCSE